MSRLDRIARLKWINLKDLRVHPEAQRDLNPRRVQKILDEFDPELLGYPTCSQRDGVVFVCDGQHRLEALRLWLGDGWESQQVQVQVYTDLTLKEEANLFDRINDVLPVTTMQKFKVRLTAQQPEEVAINKIVQANGLRVGTGSGHVACVATLRKIYKRDNGPTILGQALRMAYVSFGNYGLTSYIVEAMALFAERYAGLFDEADVVRKLQAVTIRNLETRANQTQAQMDCAIPQAWAATIVGQLNTGRGGMKLPRWWSR